MKHVCTQCGKCKPLRDKVEGVGSWAAMEAANKIPNHVKGYIELRREDKTVIRLWYDKGKHTHMTYQDLTIDENHKETVTSDELEYGEWGAFW